MNKFYIMPLTLLMVSFHLFAQNFDKQELTDRDNIPACVFPVPSERQMKWLETEFYGFAHYGPNTFAGSEWGNNRKPDPEEFRPESVPDCEQWVTSMKKAGMKGIVTVCKHHDGFCLWPTQSTDFNVLNSAEAGPETDIPRLVSEACMKHNMKFGVYVSPWDAGNEHYATPKYITDVFMRQITELCTNYGSIFEIWFDGANGGNGYYGMDKETNRTIDKATYYDWDNLLDSIHGMQPDCVVWGREFRWCGNEDGYSGKTCWSNFDIEEITVERENNSGIENGLMFIPSEVDVRTTDTWFWTPEQDKKVKTPEQLFRIYIESIGRNATLIMNCAPNTSGVIPEQVVKSLEGLGRLIKKRLTKDFAQHKTVTADKTRNPGNFDAANMTDNDTNTYWATDNGEKTGSFIIDLGKTENIHYIMLQEYIRLGQRVKSFTIETSTDQNTWTTFCEGTTIGYKRIMAKDNNTETYGNGQTARYIRVNITDSKECPLIHTVSVY